MIHTYPLITTIVSSIVFAFLFGLIANKLRLPTIVGYLVAGMILGPQTPGFIANLDLAKQLAEIGIILLMFGVGLHFSLKDLIDVNKVALPGAAFQIIASTLIGIHVVYVMGHGFLEGLIFGLSVSVASTVVLLRLLEQHRMVSSDVGKITIGWLVVEDIVMVFAIVLLPIIASSTENNNLSFNEIGYTILTMSAKIFAFIVMMVVVARKLLPKLLVFIAKSKSQELMSLGTLSIAMGFAFIAYTLFGASFALGAFLAGMVLNESVIGKKAANQSLPLRDLFSVLFFISVGMLFKPSILIREPLLVLATFAIVVIGKPVAAYIISRALRQTIHNSWIIAVSLAQIGEFSFILTSLALKLNIFTSNLYDAILASALLSIAINPLLMKIAIQKDN